jgi:hypothetical protein
MKGTLNKTYSDEIGSSDSDKDNDTDRRHDDTAAASGSQVHVWSRLQDS